MTAGKRMLLERLQLVSPAHRQAAAFVASDRTRLLNDESSTTQASAALTLWRTRLKIMSSQGVCSDEIAHLVDSLAQLPADELVEQFALVGEREAGSLFFEAKSKRFLGSSVVVMSDRATAYFRGNPATFDQLLHAAAGR